jgi:hypothetical protein
MLLLPYHSNNNLNSQSLPPPLQMHKLLQLVSRLIVNRSYVINSNAFFYSVMLPNVPTKTINAL